MWSLTRVAGSIMIAQTDFNLKASSQVIGVLLFSIILVETDFIRQVYVAWKHLHSGSGNFHLLRNSTKCNNEIHVCRCCGNENIDDTTPIFHQQFRIGYGSATLILMFVKVILTKKYFLIRILKCMPYYWKKPALFS